MARNQPPYLLVGFVTLALLIVACGGIPFMLFMVSSQPTAIAPSPAPPTANLPAPVEPKPVTKQPPAVAEVQTAKEFASDNAHSNKPEAPVASTKTAIKPSPWPMKMIP